MTLVYIIAATCFIVMSAMHLSSNPKKRQKLKPAYVACSVGMLIVCVVASIILP
jgi:NADH:ubiquinone oxidoreductase subunit 6 (subunit J)